MAETNDTIDGLLAEFRGYSAGMPASYHVTMSWADFRRMLDRFEAAHRRELSKDVSKNGSDFGQLGDAAKLREALNRLVIASEGFLKTHSAKYYVDTTEALDKAKTALAAPATTENPSAVGDAAKLREALVRVLDWLKRMNAQPLNTLAVSELTPSYAVNRTAKSIIEDNDYHISQLTAALSAPPRNCDMGTAEEQSERMDATYCSKRLCAKGKCPLFKPGLDCSLIWAQMPYEEGGAK